VIMMPSPAAPSPTTQTAARDRLREVGGGRHPGARNLKVPYMSHVLTSTIFTPSVFKMASSEARCRTAGGEGV
jgi:hypothetical protein